MIRSMTGFGVASAQVSGARYVVEIRSLNSKYFKAQIRLPEELQGLEGDLESALSRSLGRGSVVATVHFSDTSAAAAAQINTEALNRYIQQLRDSIGPDSDASRIDIGALLSLPGVIVDRPADGRLDQARSVLLQLVGEAGERVVAMRCREGSTLHTDLHKHRRQIQDRLAVIAEHAPRVVELYQQRLQDRINALLAESGQAVRDEDLLREVAVYAERSDIAEEIARLQGHLDQFAEIIDGDGDVPAGRTLDFLSQEMLREANTIASKCLDVDISRQIVEIKGAIDRIKEQAQNVE